tara:strand:+ start:4371 stop:4994 length:624 start_codon:yes stop_codon:yes gene_type:complete
VDQHLAQFAKRISPFAQSRFHFIPARRFQKAGQYDDLLVQCFNRPAGRDHTEETPMKTNLHLASAALLALALAASTSSAMAANEDGQGVAATLSITVSGFATESGTLFLGVYDAQSWSGGPSMRSARVAIEGDAVVLSIDDLAPGTYGVKVFQDLDGDGRLGTSGMGIPTEPYAFSNNARNRFGPARWDDAAFEVSAGDNAQSISIR